ncbi:uncharacterized protein LOC104428875 isoform X2 [Eucalyptus grandis]|uniref:uncharacterized protein LOC104428875 isoform X2 n=1 Tax=Eucalyptus grandis TaxID=71139 RepID=UPI00192E8A6C|nr:uncharacterized protein LOC104428875 isoform X2 [Eucalyptus grandis]
MRRDQDVKNSDFGEESEMQMLSSEDDAGTQILTQAQSLVEGSGAVLASEYKPVSKVDYLQETGCSVSGPLEVIRSYWPFNSKALKLLASLGQETWDLCIRN